MMDQNDSLEIYCRRLGHHLHFSYCRSENAGMPCAKTISCWQPRFDINGYLALHFPDHNFVSSEPPKSKLTSILDILNHVNNNVCHGEHLGGTKNAEK